METERRTVRTRHEKPERPVRTVFNGRAWINELEGKGPFRGSFEAKEAALAVGRAHASERHTAHVILNEGGEVIETRSYG